MTKRATLDQNITAFEQLQDRLSGDETGKWAVVCDRELAGLFDSFDEAADSAVCQFGKGPYLIRKVGPLSPYLSVSALFRPPHD